MKSPVYARKYSGLSSAVTGDPPVPTISTYIVKTTHARDLPCPAYWLEG